MDEFKVINKEFIYPSSNSFKKHSNLAKYRYSGDKKLLKDGSTELYTVDVKRYILKLLGLQESDLLSKAI